jgi:hypothetical protein
VRVPVAWDRGAWDRVALGLGLLAALAILGGVQLAENVSGDSARYIGLADALRTTGRYEFNFQPHTRFPPGFSLLLVAVREVLGNGYLDTLRAVALQAVPALWASYGLLRAAGRPAVGCAALALLASSPYFFERSTRAVAPEAAYMLASFASLYLAGRLARGSAPLPAASAALAAAVVAAIALRTVGVALLAPLALALVAPRLRLRAGERAAAFGPALVAGVAFQLAWLHWKRGREVETWPGEFMHTYATQLRLRDAHAPELGAATLADTLGRVFDNFVGLAASFSELATHLPFVDRVWFSPLVVLPGLLGAVGLWQRLRSSTPPLLEVYTLAYLGIVLLWPFDEGPRFVVVVFPLLLLYVALGAERLWLRAARAPARARRLAGAASLALLAGALADLARRGAPPGRQALGSLALWAFAAVASLLPLERIARTRPAAALARAALAFALAASLALGGVQIARLARENRSGSPAALRHPETLDAAVWLATEAAPGDAVMAGQEAVVHYLTGLRAIPFPVTSDPALIRDVLERQRVRWWMVLEDEPYPFFYPTERARFERFEAAYPGLTRTVRAGRNYRIVAWDREAAGERK